jgi:hypothetical protein
LVNATLFGVVHQWVKRTFPFKEVLIAVIILLGSLIYGYLKMGAVGRQMIQNPPLKIGLVQGNIDQSVKWDESFQKETLKIYEKLSFKVAEGNPDLIIWPETATPFFFQDAKEYQPLILDIPKKTNAFLLFGTPSYKIQKGKVNHYNSAYLVSSSGELVGKYDKIHLVLSVSISPCKIFFSSSDPWGKALETSNPEKKSSILHCLKANSAFSSVLKSFFRISAGGSSKGGQTFWSPSRTMPGLGEPLLLISISPWLHSGPLKIESLLPGRPIPESPDSSIQEERF